MTKQYDKMVARIMRGTDYAVRVLKFQPERYRFPETKIPRLNECGCLIGLIGQGAHFGRVNTKSKERKTIFAVTCYIEDSTPTYADFDHELYRELDKLSRDVNSPWQENAKLAAKYLKRAVANVLKTYKPKAA